MKSWKDSDISALVRWMEDRQELLRGSTAAWTKQAAEELFPDQADIDALKIKRKFHNMKRQWGEAKKMHKESGFGVREKDCEVSINGMNLAIHHILY